MNYVFLKLKINNLSWQAVSKNIDDCYGIQKTKLFSAIDTLKFP